MNDLKELRAVVDRLMAGSLVQQAQIDVLLSLCRSLGERIGVTEIDRLPLVDWFQREKLAQVETMLIQFEDKNPGVAACLQGIVDESQRRIGEEPTPE